MGYKIAVRAFDRPLIPTIELFREFKERLYIFIEDEKLLKNLSPEYLEFKTIITGTKGLPSKTNAILDYFDEGENILICNDDVKAVCKKENKSLRKLSLKSIDNLINEGFDALRGYNLAMWGLYPVQNAYFMKNKVSLGNLIVGNFFGIKNTKTLRSHLAISCKEDHYMTAKAILNNGGVVRFDNYCAMAPFKNKGGMSMYRTEQKEKEEVEFLLKIYPFLFKRNPKRKNEILFEKI